MPYTQDNILENYQKNLLGVFGQPQAVLERGQGAKVWDENGNEFLDLLGGIAVNVLGHAHPRWVRAISEQANKLGHISNFFTSPQQIQLAQKLLNISNAPEGARVFFTNSGAEANEAAFKLARKNGNEKSDKKTKIVAIEGAFHGRTMGALALTAKKAYRRPFEPLPEGVVHIAPTFEALENVMDESVSALMVEPIRGEQGVYALPEGWLQKARDLTRQYGALLMVDEVQTGIGRTGYWFASLNHLDSDNFPDVITLAKGLGAGFPIGAMITMNSDVSKILTVGDHGTTFGGNPLATAAGLATLQIIQDENLMSNVLRVSEILAQGLGSLECVGDVRAYGFLIGFDLVDERDTETQILKPLGAEMVSRARAKGYIINTTGGSTIRLAPPLILTEDQANSFLKDFPKIVEAFV